MDLNKAGSVWGDVGRGRGWSGQTGSQAWMTVRVSTDR